MDTLLLDLRYALRMLLKSPGFAAAAVLTLALGIGATMMVFAVVNGVLIRPLPYAGPRQLAMIWTTGPDVSGPSGALPLSAANFLDIRERTKAFEQVAAFRSWSYTLSEGTESELVDGARVSAELFSILGVRPLLGRTFSAADDRPGAGRVVVLSHALWQRKYGGSMSILGRQIALGGEPYTVMGVLPPGWAFPRGAELPSGLQFPPRTELWTPMAFTEREATNRGTLNLAAVGRLRPGTTTAVAQAELAAIARSLRGDFPPFGRGYGLRAVTLHDQAVGALRPRLLLLLGAAAFVLLIACANVANLLATRIDARQREMAIRGALGAGAARLARQLVTECVLLTVLGAALGALVALWGTDAMLRLVPGDLPRADDVVPDARVLVVTLLVAGVAGTMFGLASAAHIARRELGDALQGGGKGTAGVRPRRVRGALVSAEVALSLVLLIGAALLATSFARVHAVSPGFQPRGVLAGGLLLPISDDFNQQRDGARWLDLFTRYINRLAELPGIDAVGGVSALPLTGARESTDFTIDGQPTPLAGAALQAEFAVVTPDYFRAIGIPVRQGRAFTPEDRADAVPTIVISEAMARRYWPGESPVGRRISVGFEERLSREIVGVVGDVKQTALDAESQPTIYFPLAQSPYPFLSIVVRGRRPQHEQVAVMRRELRALDPALAFSDLRPLDSVLSDSLAERRFSLTLLACFAGAALLLAGVGLYGAIAFAVGQRTREIGIRVALGARPADALRLVVGDGVRVIGAGLAIGLPAALLLSGLLRSQLYGVSASEPVVYAGMSAFLIAVALLATYFPARRATEVDPMLALRAE